MGTARPAVTRPVGDDTEATMTEIVRVMVERGKKRVVASAFDWIGWERNATSEAEALAVLVTYRARYAKVAELAGLAADFKAAADLEVVERVEGTGSTDFHGISMRSAAPEFLPMTEVEAERKISLLRACWAFFDDTAPRVSPEMRMGPKGGGRDRDRIVRHTLFAEAHEFAKKVGVRTPYETLLTPDGLRAHREAYVDAIRAASARGVMARTWTLQFTLRRSAYHLLDHAWEMEDKDLSGPAGAETG
jgi:hypothetical protein